MEVTAGGYSSYYDGSSMDLKQIIPSSQGAELERSGTQMVGTWALRAEDGIVNGTVSGIPYTKGLIFK